MIDDKLMQLSGNDLINFLKTIKSDDIKTIEVITNPPAKYSAEGNSGIVNIKLKKAKPNSWNSSIRSTYQQATYAEGALGGNFNYQKNKFSLFSNVNYTNGATGPIETQKTHYPDQLWSAEDKRKDYANSLRGRIGFDYKFSEKFITGVQYAGSSGEPNINTSNVVNIINNATQQLSSLIQTTTSTKTKTNLNSFNYHAIYEIDSLSRTISLDFDYFNYQNNKNGMLSSKNYYGNGSYIPNSYFSLNDRGIQNISNYSLNIDMEHPAKWINLDYGGRLSFSNTSNDINSYNLTSGNPVFDPSKSNVFNYKENTQALYFSANKKIGEKWDSKMGLRIENTQITGNSITLHQLNKYSYSEFFPTAYIAYTPNENNSFSVNYGRRISRPPFFWLNPFKWYLNRYAYAEGNPYLKPSYTDNIEFNYTYKENWSNDIYVSFISDGYGQISILNDYPFRKIYATNYYKGRTIGLSESYTYKKLNWWSSVNTLDLSYSYSKSTIPFLLQKKEGFNTYFSTSNDFILNSAKTVLFNINYWYSFPGVSDLDKSTSSSQLDATLKILLLNKKLQIAIAGNDIFSSNRPKFTSYSDDIEVSFKNYYDFRNLRISLLYKFGNNLLKSNQRNFKNEEEKNRTN